jgi:hypothetical protein
MAAVAREVGVDALVKMSQMIVSQMNSRTPPRALSSGSIGSASCANRIGRVDVFFPVPVSERLQLVRCIHTRRGTGLRPRMRNRPEYRHGEVSVHLSRIHGEPHPTVS